MLKVEDVTWKKYQTETADHDPAGVVVIGTFGDIEIGHYCNRDSETNSIMCCINIREEDNSGVFINRTFQFKDGMDDNYFRNKIVNAHNNYHRIKEIFS